MDDPVRLLNLASSVVGLANTMMIWPMLRGAAGRRWMAWPLLAVTAATAGLVLLAIRYGHWSYVVTAGLLGMFVLVHWDNHVGARRGRPGRRALLLSVRQLRSGGRG